MNASEPLMKHRNGKLMLSKPVYEHDIWISCGVDLNAAVAATGVEVA